MSASTQRRLASRRPLERRRPGTHSVVARRAGAVGGCSIEALRRSVVDGVAGDVFRKVAEEAVEVVQVGGVDGHLGVVEWGVMGVGSSRTAFLHARGEKRLGPMWGKGKMDSLGQRGRREREREKRA